MSEFGHTIKDVSLSNSSEVNAAIDKMESLLTRANSVQCHTKYPLKHETLVYAIKHMKDAFVYALDGDLIKMQQSINKSELNVNQFNDWSVNI